MQALISQEEWQEYQRLKAESQTKGKPLDLALAAALRSIAATIPKNGYFKGYQIFQLIEASAYQIERDGMDSAEKR